MKAGKKLVSLFLVLIMCFSIVPMTDMGIEASAGITLAQLRQKFPHGKYWNHANSPGASNSANNQNGYTSTPCTKHGGYIGTAQQTCNGFSPSGTQLSWQCMGYAEKLGYDATGYNPRNNSNGWYTYTSSSALNNLKPGDIVRYKNGNHSIYVTSVNGDTVTYTDCNSDDHCIIRWDATISKSTLKSTFTHIRSAPYQVENGSTNDEVFEEHPFKGTMKVTSTSKTIKALPYSSSNTVKTIVTDSEIDVVAYVYNKYGNLWYKTSSGNYIHSNYLEVVENDSLPPSNYLNAQFKVVCSEKSVKNEPLASSETIRTIKKDEIINVIGYLYNEYDNLWYILEDGGYVPHHYFSVISSNIRTPSNYFNENLIARAGKPIRSAPYSSAEEIGRTVKNDYVNIDGYLYNRYGNLWYMTNDGYFVLFSYLEQSDKDSQAPSNYVEQKFIADANKAEKYDPYNVSASNRTISKGSTISTIGYVINLYGNKWLYNNDGYYIYPSNLTCVHSYTSSITKNATCTATGVKTYKCTCGASYTEAIAKKAHTEVIDKAVAATCTKTGLTEGKHCSVCGTVTVAQQTVAKKAHTEVIDKAVAATCTKTGLTEGKHCSVCGTVTVAQQTVAAKGHKDANGDYKCDYGCGYEYEKPADPKPSDPTENCGCNCHKGGIAGFFFKIILFFQKLFKTNKVCACGVAHY